MPCLTTQLPTMAYLDKDHSPDSFQDQHDGHGEGIDAGVVLHQRVVLHTATHRGPVPSGYCAILFGDKALMKPRCLDIAKNHSPPKGRIQDTDQGPGQGRPKADLAHIFFLPDGRVSLQIFSC